VIAARERDRETTLRRGQNELAEMKKLIRLQAAAETKAADNTEKELIPMATKKEGWQKGEGPYSKSGTPDDKLKKDSGALGYHKPVDISKVVDEAWKIDGGFAGKLPNND
jgi:hypothetical protein